MANIGEQLLVPESGWKRIDDTNEKIIYSKDWESYNYSDFYGNSQHQTYDLNASIT